MSAGGDAPGASPPLGEQCSACSRCTRPSSVRECCARPRAVYTLNALSTHITNAVGTGSAWSVAIARHPRPRSLALLLSQPYGQERAGRSRTRRRCVAARRSAERRLITACGFPLFSFSRARTRRLFACARASPALHHLQVTEFAMFQHCASVCSSSTARV